MAKIPDEILDELEEEIRSGQVNYKEISGKVRTQLQGHRLKRAGERIDANIQKGTVKEADAQKVAPGALQEARRKPDLFETIGTMFWPEGSDVRPGSVSPIAQQAPKPQMSEEERIREAQRTITQSINQSKEDAITTGVMPQTLSEASRTSPLAKRQPITPVLTPPEPAQGEIPAAPAQSSQEMPEWLKTVLAGLSPAPGITREILPHLPTPADYSNIEASGLAEGLKALPGLAGGFLWPEVDVAEDSAERARRIAFLEDTGQPVPPELLEGGGDAVVAMGDLFSDPLFGGIEALAGFGLINRGLGFAQRTAADSALGVTQIPLDRLERMLLGTDIEDLPPITKEEILMQAVAGTLIGAVTEGAGKGIGKAFSSAKGVIENAPGPETKTTIDRGGARTEASPDPFARMEGARRQITQEGRKIVQQRRQEIDELNKQIRATDDFEEKQKLIVKREKAQNVIDTLTGENLKKQIAKEPEEVLEPETDIPPLKPEGEVPAPPPRAPSDGSVLKDPEGVGRDLEPSKTAEDEVVQAAPRGRRGRATTAEGDEIEFEYVLLDPEQVITSHDLDLQPRKDFPEERQPRDRTRQASLDQLTEMTSPGKFDARRLVESVTASEGAPILDNARIAEAGNMRSLVLAKIKRDRPELWKQYRELLGKRAGATGITQETLDANPEKALYRIRKSEISAEAFARGSNVEGGLARSATELAREDAGRISPELLKRFVPTESGDFGESTNRGFLTDFLNEFPASERARFIASDGTLSQEGRRRIRNAIFAKAFDDIDLIERVVENPDAGFKNITNAMLQLSPRFAALKDSVKSGDRYSGLDITKDIQKALVKFEELKSAGTDIQSYIKSGGKELFESPDATVLELLDVFDKSYRSQKKLMDFFKEYLAISDLDEMNPKQRGLIPGDTPTKEGVIRTAKRRASGEEASLFSKGKVEGFEKIPDKAGPALLGGNQRTHGSPTKDPGQSPKGNRKARAVKEKKTNEFEQASLTPEEEPAYNALSLEQTDRIIELKKNEGKTHWELQESKSSSKKKKKKGVLEASLADLDDDAEIVGAMDRARELLTLPDAKNVNTAIMDLPEIVEFYRRLSKGRVPRVQYIKSAPGMMTFGAMDGNTGDIILNIEMFEKMNEKKWAYTMAHELGHWIDWYDKYAIEAGIAGGDMIARMANIKSSILNDFQDLIQANKQMLAEAKKLSWRWRPFDETLAKAEFIAYRNLGAELYADFISALFNNPEMVWKEAPLLTKMFFGFMDNKPKLREIYSDIVEDINNGLAVDRYVDRQMYAYANHEAEQNAKIKAAAERENSWEELLIQYFDFQYGVEGRRAAAEKVAKKLGVPFIEDPRNALQELLYEGSEQEIFAKDHYSGIIGPLEEAAKKAGMPQEDVLDYFGLAQLAMLTLEGKAVYNSPDVIKQFADLGIAKDEIEFINTAMPGGITPEYAKKVLKNIADRFGESEAFLFERAREFRKVREEFVLKNRELQRMFPEDTLQIMEAQEYYVALDVSKHLDKRYGIGPSAQIFHRVGTMEEIGNPFLATFYKDINIMHAANLNKAKRETIRMMKTYFPEETTKLGKGDYARSNKIWVPKPPKNPGMELVTYLDKGGKLQAYYVPKAVAAAFDTTNAKANTFTKWLSFVSIPIRDLLVNKNPGFMLFNSVRDYYGVANQLPGVGTNIFTIAQDWFKALSPAFKSTFGTEIPDDIRPLFKNKGLISVSLKETLTDSDLAYERLLYRYHIKPKLWKNKVVRPISQVLQGLDDLNKAMERTAKIASYYHIKRTHPNMNPRDVARLVRTLGGSPAFLRRGRMYNTYNNIFLFSNAIKEGFRSTWEAGQLNPASFALKTLKTAFLPKMLMYAGIVGFFGEEMKEWFQKIPEYDLTNYDVIPLGINSEGEPIYIRVPKQEFDRFVGGVFWKALNLTRDADSKGISDILNYAGGQIPTANPALKALYQGIELASGRNPFDSFRNRQLIPDKVFEAQDIRTLQYFLKAQWNNLGGSVLFKFDTSDTQEIKTGIDRVLGMPGISNVLGRFIKVSDQGIDDRLRLIEERTKRDRAREILNVDEILLKFVDGQEITLAERQMLAREKNIRQKINQLIIKRSGDRRLRILKGTKSKKVKEAMIRELNELEGR